MAVAQPIAQLVYVPRIGFRPVGTAALTEPRQTFAHDTRLTLLAVAAATDRIDMVVEWERDPATCGPDPQVVAALRHSERRPLDRMTITLADGKDEVRAIASTRLAYAFGPEWKAAQTITFPAAAGALTQCELRVGQDGQNWRVPFSLGPAAPNARALTVQAERDGVAVRATALARYGAELVVALEAEAQKQIRQVGWPYPVMSHVWSGDPEPDRQRAESARQFFSEHMGGQLAPITLEGDRGGPREEVRRLLSPEPQQGARGGPFISRFAVVFDAPDPEMRTAALVVPFVALNDPAHSVTVDLRDVPIEVALGAHRFRVVSTAAHGADETKVTMDIPPSTGSPRFVQPRRMQGADPERVGWEGKPVEAGSADVIWMATPVGDPPVVTFQGAVLRVDGPFRLDLPLA